MSTRPADPPAEYAWRVHLARREPGRALAVGAILLAVVAWTTWAYRNPLLPAAAAFLLLGAVGEFLFPTRYRLTLEAAEVRNPFYWRRIAWKEVKRVGVGEHAIRLSPLRYPSPRDTFRGVLLRWDGNREEVLERIRQFREAALEEAPRVVALAGNGSDPGRAGSNPE